MIKALLALIILVAGYAVFLSQMDDGLEADPTDPNRTVTPADKDNSLLKATNVVDALNKKIQAGPSGSEE